MNNFTINFDTFPISHNKIKIPKDTILFRGYNPKYSILSDRPSYFTSNYNLALQYSKLVPNGKVGIFKVFDDLQLYDLRYFVKTIRNTTRSIWYSTK